MRRSGLTLIKNECQVVLTDFDSAFSGNPPFQHGQLLPTLSTCFPIFLTFPNEIFLPGPALRDELEEGRSHRTCAWPQRRGQALHLYRLNFRKVIVCFERRAMLRCSIEIRNRQLQITAL